MGLFFIVTECKDPNIITGSFLNLEVPVVWIDGKSKQLMVYGWFGVVLEGLVRSTGKNPKKTTTTILVSGGDRKVVEVVYVEDNEGWWTGGSDNHVQGGLESFYLCPNNDNCRQRVNKVWFGENFGQNNQRRCWLVELRSLEELYVQFDKTDEIDLT